MALDIRPRTTGEILDDAWRLYLADAPRLLILHGLFHVPAFSFLLILVGTRPTALIFQLLMPLVAAVLLALTGLGSAAVQQRLLRLADGRDPSLAECVGASLRRTFEHAALRSMLLLACLFIVPALAVWPVAATLPTVIADGKGLWQNFGRIGQDARFDPSKASAIVFCRLPILLMAFVNAHLLVQVAVWVAGNLGGFDVALVWFQLDLNNPVYVLALVLGVWLLLGPFFEVSNYLLYLDTRTRLEGLDLLYRVQRAFGAVEPKRVAVVLLALAGWLLAVPLMAAPPERVEAVRQVRREVETIRDEVKDAEPYRNGDAIERRLLELGKLLDSAWPGDTERFPWFRTAATGFKDRTQRDAVLILDELLARLTVLEEALAASAPTKTTHSKDDIKKLLTKPTDPLPTAETNKKKQQDSEPIEPKRPEIRRDGASGPSVSGPMVSVPAGAGNVCWFVFAGLMLAIVLAALVLFFVNRPRRKAQTVETGRASAQSVEETIEQLHRQPVAALLRRADELARQGQHLEALRTAYLATLSLLHRKQLLRYEPTRTNGEYVREVRLAPTAPQALHEPFHQLTAFFEVKWYGERACEGRDYNMARELVETIQGIVGGK